MDKGKTQDNGLVSQKSVLKSINVGLTYMSLSIKCALNVKNFYIRKIILEIIDQYDTKIDLTKYISVTYLYFIVQ